MAVQLSISYESLVDLVEQLPDKQRRDLLRRLSSDERQRELTTDERMTLLRRAQIDLPLREGFSLRREDWYGDEGR
jgi:hypothetical protein